MDDLSFLEANFDLNKLTKPQLRGIISVHAPKHLPPSSAKKDELIKVIEREILPRANQILSAKRKVRPSATGITFLDEDSRPSPIRLSSSKSSASSSIGDTTTSSPLSRKTSPKRRASARKISSDTPTQLELYSPLARLEKSLPSFQDSPKTATQKLAARLELSKSSDDTVVLDEKFYIDWAWIGRTVWEVFSVLLGLSVAIALSLFIRWKYIHPFPYCNDTHVDVNPLSSIFTNPTSGLSILNEYCIACPRHGRCSSGRLSCLDGFQKRANWGLGHSCVPDRKQLELVERLSRTITDILSTRAGQIICSSHGDSDQSRGMSEADLKELLLQDRNLISIPKFDHIFKLSIDDLIKEQDGVIQVRRDVNGVRVFESLQPKLPVMCRAKLMFIGFLARFKYQLVCVLITILIVFATYLKLSRNRRDQKRTMELVEQVVNILAQQAAIHRRDPLVPASLIVDQLRDALFFKEPKDAYLWPLVCRAINANSNIREQSVHSHGHFQMSWEWIGLMGHTAGGGSSDHSPTKHAMGSKSSTRGLYPSLDF